MDINIPAVIELLKTYDININSLVVSSLPTVLSITAMKEFYVKNLSPGWNVVMTSVVGLLTMIVSTWVLRYIFKRLVYTERQFIMSVLLDYDQKYGENLYELSSGDCFYLSKQTICLYSEVSSSDISYRYAYKIIVNADRRFEYCLFTNKEYDLTKNDICHDFIVLSKTNHMDWSTYSFHLLDIQLIDTVRPLNEKWSKLNGDCI